MSRWRKGTLDHDGDGKMGGSNPKESSMTAKKKTDETKANPLDTPVPATQEKPSEEYDGEPMTKAPNKRGAAAFDGEEGLRARNATMETDAVKADGQTSTASKAKGG